MTITESLDLLEDDLGDLTGAQEALLATARRLAEILDDPATPLSNVDRVSKELRTCIAALTQEPDDEPFDPIAHLRDKRG